jgi:ABC-2 type transport system permease protein
MKAIYKRELRAYLQNMTGCIFIAFLTALVGVYFMAINLNYGYPYFSYTLSGVLFILMIAVPILTMRSFAEDRKNKTDQLLLTSPVSLGSVVMGKYLSMVTILGIPTVIFCFFPLIIMTQGNAYPKVDYPSILMFFLLGCVYISIGMFLSALTESQIIAVISTYGVLIVIYLWDSLSQFLPSSAGGNAVGVGIIITLLVLIIYQMTKNGVLSLILELIGVLVVVVLYVVKSSLFESLLSNVMGNLSLLSVFTDVSDNHLFNISGIVLYLSLIGLFVFLTMQSIQKRRWS